VGCVFCRIRDGEIPSTRVFEDERTLAFIDIDGTVTFEDTRTRRRVGPPTTVPGQAPCIVVARIRLDHMRYSPDGSRLAVGGCAPRILDAHTHRAIARLDIGNRFIYALRFSPDGTPPLLTASTLGERVELRIVDRGPGIPEADRDRIFVPFQRLGDTDNTTGVGLGLALSRGLTEAMGGTLEPEDTPGGGLTMTLSLPAAPAPGRDVDGQPGRRELARIPSGAPAASSPGGQ